MELARSIPVRPWPLTPQGGASPSFNERADEPPTPGTYRASKALASIKIPGNLSLEARGQNAKEQGEYYENEVRKALNFDAATPPPGVKYKKGDSAPDGIFTDSETGQKIALEVKYFNKNKSGVHDPDNMLSFMADKDVNQARKYLDAFEGGLSWIVNDRELVYRYDYFFRRNGFSGFRIEYIESR